MNNISGEQLLEQCVDELIKAKGFDKMPAELLAGVRKKTIEQATRLVNAEIMVNLPEEKLAELEKISEEEQVNPEEVSALINSANLDLASIERKALDKFREIFMNSDMKKAEEK